MSSEKHFKIVGAGPSGLVAAITLQKAGYQVTVYEARREVGARFHGDFQGIENWSQEEDIVKTLDKMGIAINFRCAPFFSGRVFGPTGQSLDLQSKTPFFYLVRRGTVEDSLDQGLKAQALDAGVEIRFGERKNHLTGCAITATGPKGADAIAKGVTFETDLPDQSISILDDNIAPGGYAYFLVHEGMATMATVLFRDYPREKIYFERMQAAFRKHLDFDMKNPREFGGFGNFYLVESEEHVEHLYVGEAAGFQDFLWGFGMRYAMVSGYLAAQSIIQGISYDTLWKRELLPSLQGALVNRSLIDRFGTLAYRFLMMRLSRHPDTRAFMRVYYGLSPWKRLLLPLAERHYQSRVKDERCIHPEHCDCVWCRCEKE